MLVQPSTDSLLELNPADGPRLNRVSRVFHDPIMKHVGARSKILHTYMHAAFQIRYIHSRLFFHQREESFKNPVHAANGAVHLAIDFEELVKLLLRHFSCRVDTTYYLILAELACHFL